MTKKMMTIEEAARLIATGKNLLLAGDEKALSQLPKGSWMGGTIPYFVGEEGGAFAQDRVLATEWPEAVEGAEIKTYTEETVSRIYADIPDNGFGFALIPGMSRTHLAFAVGAPGYERFAMRPLLGWITGVDLAALGKTTPKVFVGSTGERVEDGCVAMHVRLRPGKVADLGIVNLFRQGSGDTICFEATGFGAKEALVNGKKENFADYLLRTKADTKLPLVADYMGAMVNVSFQSVDAAKKEVAFYAPVFAGVEYKLAAPVGDYVGEFAGHIPQGLGGVAFSCNCILNYLYSELEGKKTGDFVGPITFGEIAYQLLNQTLVYLKIEDAV